MRTPTVFHPQYITHVQPTVNSLINLAHCIIYRPNPDRPGWTPGVGNDTDGHVAIWEGPCRVQPNIDWRARTRNVSGEYDATMATRIDIPMSMNEHGATRDGNNKITAYADDPVFAFGDVVQITQVNGPGQETLLAKGFTVRNALPSTTMFQHNLLCDSGTSLHG